MKLIAEIEDGGSEDAPVVAVDESTERRGQSCRCDVIATRLLRFRFERGCGNRVYGGGERQTIAATMNYATVAYSLNSFRITVASINTCALIVCSPCKPGRRRAARAPVQSGALEGSQRRLTSISHAENAD